MPEALQTISVLVVEDDAIVRAWIRLALEHEEFVVAGEAPTTAAALALAARRHADLLLVDYRLPDRLGTELIRELRFHGDRTPAVVITARPEPGLNEAAREAGAQGTMLKRGSAEELLAALRRVSLGEEAFDHRFPRRTARASSLTPRERDVMRLLTSGATNREISAQLAIGSETVKTLVSRIYAKLGVSRRAEAIAAAHAQGMQLTHVGDTTRARGWNSALHAPGSAGGRDRRGRVSHASGRLLVAGC
jgi:DNA-binding NarL/FixJ family response regulator